MFHTGPRTTSLRKGTDAFSSVSIDVCGSTASNVDVVVTFNFVSENLLMTQAKHRQILRERSSGRDL